MLLLAMLLCGGFRPPEAVGQTRCAVASGSIVSIEGEVFVLRPPASWTQLVAAGPDTQLCAGDVIRIGPRSRAALRLQDTDQLIRLDQGTTLRVLPPRQPGRPLLDLSRGIIELFSPGNRPLDVDTPYVTAGVEGTEFLVSVDAARRTAEVGVIAGRVHVENPQGRLSLAAGEAAVAQSGSAPRRLDIRPRDQVRWAIYYPPAVWELPAAGAPIDPRVLRAWQDWRANRVPAAVREINAISSTEGFNGPSLDFLSAMLISLGRTDEAGHLLDRSQRLDPRSPRSLALRAVVEIAGNRPQEAIGLADAAVALAPADPAARIAQSYALQAGLRLKEARAALLAAAPANDPLVLARLAEVEFYLGDIAAAHDAAAQAVALAPSLSRPRSILGFVNLAQYSFAAAAEEFHAAAMRDPGDPLARLGLGLTSIRLGDLAAGTRDLELAVVLDPTGSVLRSYVGKAYAADSRYDPALRQWKLAKEVDLNDPTPHLYQALAERSLNRPGDALANLRQSVELNDNRAVYRSRLLLDQDLATRSADLAGVYRDLGFGQAAVAEGYKSVNADPANPSAHRFLSESFFDLPRHETASDSELLQSLLLQPLNINPPLPRLSRQVIGIQPLFEPHRIGYNEFSPLFNSDGLGLLANGFGGDRATAGGTLLASGVYRNLSMSLGQFYSYTDGIHQNADLRRRITEAIVQPALSDRLTLFAQFRYSDFKAGDFQNRFNLANFDPGERQGDNTRQYRVGGHFDVAPGVTVVGVWTRGNIASSTSFGPPLATHQKFTGDSGEAAAYLTGDGFNIIAGGSTLTGRDQFDISSFGFSLPSTNIDPDSHSVWLYGNWSPVNNLKINLGIVFDELTTAVNDIETLNRSTFNPKVGVSWNPLPNTTFRAAWFSTLRRPLVGDPSLRSGETIEPTQVAGFNQLFDDFPGTRTRRWGVGIDHKITKFLSDSDAVLIGAEWSQRQLAVPITVVDPSTGLPAVTEPGWKERYGRSYISWLPNDRMALNVGIDYEALNRSLLGADLDGFVDVRLLRVPLELRYFDAAGFLGLIRTTLVHEKGHFFDVATGNVNPGNSTFATVDMGIGWRYPGRPLIVTFEAQNLLDSHFHFQDTDPLAPRIFARRTLLARLTVRL